MPSSAAQIQPQQPFESSSRGSEKLLGLNGPNYNFSDPDPDPDGDSQKKERDKAIDAKRKTSSSSTANC